MTDAEFIGSFLGGEQAEGYATLWCYATVVEKSDGNGGTYLGYDFPEQASAVHMPHPIMPSKGDIVPVIVRVPIDRKAVWLGYAKLKVLGDTLKKAEAVWDTNKADLNFLPTVDVSNVKAWRRVKATPVPGPGP